MTSSGLSHTQSSLGVPFAKYNMDLFAPTFYSITEARLDYNYGEI